ncbi:hypothetical protein FRC00_006884 [Tulasnella sp. 408]|nr:hypothetical protein FRC00_006884 [Tulasnella sp. 408]
MSGKTKAHRTSHAGREIVLQLPVGDPSSSSTPTFVRRVRPLSQVDQAQIRAISKTGKFTQLQIQAMFLTDSRAIAKALEPNPKKTRSRQHHPENDDELLSAEFKAALDGGRYSKIKRFVTESIEKQDGKKKKAVVVANIPNTTESTASEASNTKKGKTIRINDENTVPASTSSSSGGQGAILGKGEPNGRIISDKSTKFKIGGRLDWIMSSSDDDDDCDGDPLDDLTLSRNRKTTLPSRTKPTTRNTPPKRSRDNTESLLQTTTLRTSTRHVNLPPDPSQADTSPPLDPPAAKLPSVDLSRLLNTARIAGRDQLLRLSKRVPSQEPRLQGPVHPSTAPPHRIKPDPDQPPSNTAFVTPNPEPRDPTPDIQELPAPRNSNSSAVRSFLSSLRPSLVQYAPAFEKLGVKTSDDLLVLKALPPASVREFLQEARKETDMTFLQSLAVISGLERYSP